MTVMDLIFVGGIAIMKMIKRDAVSRATPVKECPCGISRFDCTYHKPVFIFDELDKLSKLLELVEFKSIDPQFLPPITKVIGILPTKEQSDEDAMFAGIW
jgi:hypothetical protein